MAESFTNQAREQAESKSSFFKREKILGAFRTRRSKITGAKFKKGTSQEFIGNIESRVTANEKKITLLKNIVQLRKKNVDKESDQMGSPLLESLQSIASTTDSIRNSLIEQQDRDEGAAEKARLQREKEDREKQEKGLEKKPSMVEKMAAPVLKPVMSLWDKIWKFISTLFLGKLLMNFLDWVGNPANQDKIKSFVRFIKDWWPALTTAVLLFGTGFGSLVAGLAKSIAWFIPAMGAALAKLKAAKWMSALSMIPGAGKVATVAKGATLVGGGLLIGSQMGDGPPETEITGLNKGGQVPGSGPNKDTVPAMLTPGEFVMSRGAVEQYGADTLAGMNAAAGGTNKPQLKRVSHFNEGGLVNRIQPEDLTHVNNERKLQGLPPLDKLTYAAGVTPSVRKGPGPKSSEYTDTHTDLETMVRTITKTINGETTRESFKLSNEEAEALLKQKGYPSMRLADGSVVIDSVSHMFDKSVEMLRWHYENGDPKKIAQLEADPDFVEMWKSIEDGSLKEEVVSNSRKHKKGTKENLMQKNMNRIEEMDGGEGVKLMNFNGGGLVSYSTLNFNGGGLVQGFQNGGRVYTQEQANAMAASFDNRPQAQIQKLRNERDDLSNNRGSDGKLSRKDRKRWIEIGKEINAIQNQIIASQGGTTTPTKPTKPITSPTPSVNQQKKDTKPQGLWRGITGAADFMTGGMWDFDQRNPEGSPKDWGIRRMAGGLADWATMGLTDFDKRGKGNLQFNPIGGGDNKKWDIKPKEKKNVIVALEQEANQNGSEIQQQQPAGNDIPAFDVAPIRDPLKMEILDIVVF